MSLSKFGVTTRSVNSISNSLCFILKQLVVGEKVGKTNCGKGRKVEPDAAIDHLEDLVDDIESVGNVVASFNSPFLEATVDKLWFVKPLKRLDKLIYLFLFLRGLLTLFDAQL